jgi:cystathionine beta-lyase
MSSTPYDFDTPVIRRGTGSMKWERYAGRDVLPMWVADMDFRSAPEIIAELKDRADDGVFGYTIPYEEVIREVLAYLARGHGIQASAADLVFTPGVVPALTLICQAYAGPGEGVMTATPVYPPFLTCVEAAGRALQAVPLRTDGRDRWTLDFDAMESAVMDSTRLFIFCNPHNPVGRVYTRTEIDGLISFCERHDLVLCVDDIHCDLILDDVRHVSVSSLGDSVAERCVTLNAPSKTYNLPGLACAYAVISNPTLRARFQRAADKIITEINAFGYTGCAAAYRHGEPWRRALIDYLRGNRDLVYSYLGERVPEIRLRPMEATYLAWLDVRALSLDSPGRFFAEHGVGLSDGAAFAAPGYVRLNFGCPRSQLAEGLKRIESAVASTR